MQIVHAQEEAMQACTVSIFLVGPTPRNKNIESWRPYMLSVLECLGYDGVVFTPEPRDGKWCVGYDHQVEWESKHLELADIIIARVPRKCPSMPTFATNVEFGEWLRLGKLLYCLSIRVQVASAEQLGEGLRTAVRLKFQRHR